MSYSKNSSQLAELKQSTESLVQEFLTLAARARLLVVERLEKCELPCRETLGEIQDLERKLESLKAAATHAGVQGDLHSPNAILAGAMQAIEQDTRMGIRIACRESFEGALHVLPKNGATPSVLQAVHDRARECLRELDACPELDPGQSEAWRRRSRPFAELLRVLHEPNTVEETEGELILRNLASEFGSGLITAIALSRLTVGSSSEAEAPATVFMDDTSISVYPDSSIESAEESGEKSQVGVDRASTEAGSHVGKTGDEWNIALPLFKSEECASAIAAAVDQQESGDATTSDSAAPGKTVDVQHNAAVGDCPATSEAEPPTGKHSAEAAMESSCAQSGDRKDPAKVIDPLEAAPRRETPAPTNGRSGAAPITSASTHQEHATILPSLSTSDERSNEMRRLVWRLLAEGRIGLAHQITRCCEELGITGVGAPAVLFRAALLGPAVHEAGGEVVDELRKCVQELQPRLSALSDSNVDSTPIRLVSIGLSLRPALLAPTSGAVALLQEPHGAFQHWSTPLEEISSAIREFGAHNLELSAPVLKGVCDHARWRQDLERLQEEARAWLDANRQACIIYAPATDIWRRWLQNDKPVGRAMNLIAGGELGRAGEVRQLVQQLSQRQKVEQEIVRADREIRHTGARRRPIEARAQKAIYERVREWADNCERWLHLVGADPGAPNDFRQRCAERCRKVVQRHLPDAIRDLEGRERSGASGAALQASIHYLRLALEGIGRLFDPQSSETLESPPLRVLLGGDLLGMTGVSFSETWEPINVDASTLLDRLEAVARESYDATTAFQRHADRGDHWATQRIIESLEYSSGDGVLAERLQRLRDEALPFQRSQLRDCVEKTRREVEQAVCFDLITDEERGRYAAIVEECRLLADEVCDFPGELFKLEQVEKAIDEKRQKRVAEVSRRFESLAASTNRKSDLKAVEKAIDRKDYVSADEYMELIRQGQPLGSEPSPAPAAFSEFFPSFSNRLHTFLEGNGDSRPEPRDLIRRMREMQTAGRDRALGPILMSGVPGPQAAEAAEMAAAWYRLKRRETTFDRDLKTLLTAFGFRNVSLRSHAVGTPTVFACDPLGDSSVCSVPYFGSQAKGRYRIIPLYDRPDEETIVRVVQNARATEPVIVLYFGRMTEQRRRDLAEFSWKRNLSFLTIDECLVWYLCQERFHRLPVLFQCALPFTVSNPYTTTASLVPVEMFYGRERERRSIVDPSGGNLVYGGRQLGKSALLRDVERREHDSQRGRIVRWIDLKNQGIGIDRPTQDLWSVIGRVLHDDRVLLQPATTFNTVGSRITEWLKGDATRRILLLLDEADAFLEADSRAVNEKTHHSFPEVSRLKGLMDDTERRFKVVFAGLHNVQRAARDPNTPVAHLGAPLCIGPLLDNGEWKRARDLVETPFRQMGLVFDPPDLWMRILSYTNYYPSLVQVFCKHLLEFVSNRERVAWDFRNCPPYRINAAQIEEVYQSESLQAEVRHKFELTLGLDERYRMIALCIALASIEHRDSHGLADGFDVAWVREQALSWWPRGFADDASFELFRTILDEMIGLGILRRTSQDQYALRSANVLNLLGSKALIEQKLLDLGQLPTQPVYEAAAFRRALDTHCWVRSPLTAEQEALLMEQANGVAVVFASPLSGLDQLEQGLKNIPWHGSELCAPALGSQAEFASWMREVEQNRREGLTVAVVGPNSRWSPLWVQAAAELITKKRTSSKRFLRFVFIADPDLAWRWCKTYRKPPRDVRELSLKPWRAFAVLRWLSDADFGPDAVNSFNEVLEQTGGWGMVINCFADLCKDSPHDWRGHLDAIVQSWPNDARWRACRSFPAEARQTLLHLAQWDAPITTEEWAALAGQEDLTPILRWAERLCYISETEPDTWSLNRLVGQLVSAGA